MKVLFICKGNWVRSQIAAAIFNRLTGSTDAFSAGTNVGTLEDPEGKKLSELFSNSSLFDLMNAKGMEIRDNKTIRLTPELLREADTVVSMAEEPYRPAFLLEYPGVLWWDVENPEITNKEVAERVYQKIENLVSGLVTQLRTS